jgi:hypothetical protein
MVQARLEETYKQCEELKKHWDEDHVWMLDNCVKFGKEKGWVISPDWPVPFVEVILDSGKTAEEIDSILLMYYTENDGRELKELFKKLRELRNEKVEQWYSLIDDCIDIYKKGYFRPVIPSLISIIEGIPAMGAGNPQAKHIKNIKEYCNSKAKQYAGNYALGVVWASIVNYMDSLFMNSFFRDSRPLSINRHRVQHGRDNCAEWQEIDAIKLFNTVHALIWAILDYESSI